MSKLNSLHIDIAKVLAECAKNKTTINYGDLCNKIHYPSPRSIGKELEKVSLLTYEKYGIFLSVLVVSKETQEYETPMPGMGFITMYINVCGEPSNIEAMIKSQQEQSYAQDWSELPDIIRNKINEEKHIKA